VSWDSVSSIETGLRTERAEEFSVLKTSRPALGPTHTTIQWLLRTPSTVVKGPEA
jgi:hypothetical protein